MQRVGVTAKVVLLGALGFACGSDPVRKSPTDTTQQPQVCEAPSFADPSLKDVTVGQVKATLVGVDDTPATGVTVSICGTIECTRPVDTDEQGNVTIDLEGPMRKPAFKFGDGIHQAELAILLDDPPAELTFPKLTSPALPAETAPIAAGTSSESAGVTLTLAAGAKFELVVLDPSLTQADLGFRAAELPAERIPEELGHGESLETVFTLAPLGGTICPPAKLSVPNSAGWEPGTSVEFLLEGLDLGPTEEAFAPYGEWQSVATGVVDDSGERVEMTDGGLPMISNVGVRRL